MGEEQKEKFYYHGVYFDNKKDLLEYVKEFSQRNIDYDMFEILWKSIGKTIWTNIEVQELKIKFFEMDKILYEDILLTMLSKILYNNKFKNKLNSKIES